jgi:hypothetical protein
MEKLTTTRQEEVMRTILRESEVGNAGATLG